MSLKTESLDVAKTLAAGLLGVAVIATIGGALLGFVYILGLVVLFFFPTAGGGNAWWAIVAAALVISMGGICFSFVMFLGEGVRLLLRNESTDEKNHEGDGYV